MKHDNNTHQFDGVICAPVPDDVPGGQATFCVSRFLFEPFPHLSPWERIAVLIESQEHKNMVSTSDIHVYQISQAVCIEFN